MNFLQKGSKDILARVMKAREIQQKRYKDYKDIHCNAQMTKRLLQEYCQLNKASLILLKKVMEVQQLSARAYDRILKMARTIADLEEKEKIQAYHLAEAVDYRNLDRENWVQ